MATDSADFQQKLSVDASGFTRGWEQAIQAASKGSGAVRGSAQQVASGFTDMMKSLQSFGNDNRKVFTDMQRDVSATVREMNQSWRTVSATMASTADTMRQSGEQIRTLAKTVQGVQQQIAAASQAARGKTVKDADDQGGAWDHLQEKVKESAESISSSAVRIGISLSAKYAAVKYGSAMAAGVAALAGEFYLAYETIKWSIGLITGESLKLESIDAFIKVNEQVKALQQQLEVSAQEALAYADAMARLGVNSADVASVHEAVAAAVRTNAEELDRLGIKYTDANGQMLDQQTILTNIKSKLDEYTEGYDRNAAAAAIGVGSYERVVGALKITEAELQKSKARLDDYQLSIGPESQKAVEEYEQAMREFNHETELTSQGFERAIVDGVMPILTDLAKELKDGFPGAVKAFRYAVGTAVSAFYGLQMSGSIVVRTLDGVARALGELFSGIGKSIGETLSGNFSAAADSIKASISSIGHVASTTFDDMVNDALHVQQRVALAFGGDDRVDSLEQARDKNKSGKGGKSWKPKSKAEKKAKESSGTDPSQMPAFEAELAEAKNVASQLDAIHGMSLQQELAFWQEKAKMADLSEKDQTAIRRKLAEARIAIAKDEAQKGAQLEQIGIDAVREAALAKVDREQQSAQDLAAVGEISQANLLAMEEQFELRRFAIKQDALARQAALIDPDRDPVALAQVQSQIEAMEQQHQAKLGTIMGQQLRQTSEEARAIWGSLSQTVSSLWDQGIQAMMNGTLRWSNAWRAVGLQMTKWFGTEVVGKQVTTWLGAEAKKLAVSMGFMQAEQGARKAGSAQAVGTKLTEANAVIGANAAEAGAGAAASQASIPWVGPVLAVAAMASIFAAVSAMRGGLKSASGGYDIPGNINPLVQAHASEMILPAKHADVIRSLADNGGAAGGGVHNYYTNINSPDTGGFKRLLMDNPAAVASAVRNAHRNGHFS